MKFEFATSQRIIFGDGALEEIGALAAAYGRRALVVTGAQPDRARRLLRLLTNAEIQNQVFSVAGEPKVSDIIAGVDAVRAFGAELIIGFGGGSAIDAAKAIAAFATNHGDVFDYLEVIGRAQPLANPSLPVIAVPTTAGTGSEVTRNAVLTSPEHGVKVSVRSPSMLPRIALVDPTLTYTMSPAVTAATGLDALTQLIEPFVSVRANPMTDALCREGLRQAARALMPAVRRGDHTARGEMAFASLCGGMALANAGLGAVHGFAGPFGGMFGAPHGAVCAALLPEVCAANVRALRKRVPEHRALQRYREVAELLTGSTEATIDDAIIYLRSLISGFEIPPLAQYGFTPAHIPELVEKARVASSMKANPIVLLENELTAILHACLETHWPSDR